MGNEGFFFLVRDLLEEQSFDEFFVKEKRHLFFILYYNFRQQHLLFF